MQSLLISKVSFTNQDNSSGIKQATVNIIYLVYKIKLVSQEKKNPNK